MHHRQAFAEDVDSGEAAVLQDVSAANRFQKREAQQQIDVRREIERMAGEFGGDLVRRVGDDRAAAFWRQYRRQEIGDEIERESIINYIAGNDGVPAAAQHVDDGAAAGRRLPHRQRQGFDAQQRFDGERRSLVQIEPAFGVRMSTNLARVIETNPRPGDCLC